MWILFAEGGYPMWFLVFFGVCTLLASAAFAYRPRRKALRLALGLGTTTLFSIGTGVAADLAQVGHHVPQYVQKHPDTTLTEAVLQGFAESMSPAIFGGFILTICALWVSLGLWRGYTD
jgi:hypothetical protein